MMTKRQYYLLKLIEECAEVAQRAAKSMQFGSDESQAQGGQNPDRPVQAEHLLTNKERLSSELNDLLAVAVTLDEMGEVDSDLILSDHAMDLKQVKIKKYLKYNQSIGMVEHD